MLPIQGKNFTQVILRAFATIICLCASISENRTLSRTKENLYDRHSLVDITTKVTPIKQMYIIYDTLTISHPLELTKLENTIDTLSAKLASLRYATTVENLHPLNLIGKGSAIVLFQTILPLTASYQACKILKLEPLSLSNLPEGINSQKSILLQYEISVGSNTVICISQHYTTKGNDCLQDIFFHPKKLFAFNSTAEMQSHLIENFSGTVAYISILNDKAVFTSSPYGNSACLGTYFPSTDGKEHSQMLNFCTSTFMRN